MKKKLVILLALMCSFVLSCTDFDKKDMKTKKNMEKTISKEEALEIAENDASKVYHDLSIYRIEVVNVTETWRVDYFLADTNMNGGGPHYIISESTGEILEKRYEQ